MKINEKFYKKYATNAVILPPPPEDVESKELEELPLEPGDLTGISLKQDALPEIKDLSPEELDFWDKWYAAKENVKDFNIGGLSGKEDSTIPPPGKKASSSDDLVKLCSAYYNLAIK